MQTSLRALQRGYSPGDFDLEVTAKAALIAGLAGSQSPNSLSPTCSSGNCTFKATEGVTYTTAGFSSECIDISNLITQNRQLTWASKDDVVTSYSLPFNLTLSWLGSGNGFWDTMLAWKSPYPDTSAYHAHLPNKTQYLENTTMTERQRDIFLHTAFDGIAFLMPTTSPCEDPAYYWGSSRGGGWPDMPPVNVSSCPPLARSLPGVISLPGYFSVTAAFCYFYSSVQNYNGSIINGRLVEHPVGDPAPLDDVWDEAIADPDSPWPESCDWQCGFSDPCIVENVIYTKASANLSAVPGGLTNLSKTTGPSRCLYGFSGDWLGAFVLQPIGTLTSIITNTDESASTELETCYEVLLSNYTAMVCRKAWWLRDIYNGGNASITSISAFMKRGMDSLTAELRMMGTDWSGNRTVAVGTAWEMAVCTHFRWQWMLYPLAMFVGTLVLLLAVIISSSGFFGLKREVIWKASILPFLFYGLEDAERKGDELEPEDALKRASKAVRVRMTVGDDGWRLHTR